MEPEMNPDSTSSTQGEHACTISGCDCEAFVPANQNYMFCGNCKHKKTEHGTEYCKEQD